jgi:hypothetical protein
MQLVASVALIVIGLWLALLSGAAAEMRVFGWFVAGLGVLGLVFRVYLARQRNRSR